MKFEISRDENGAPDHVYTDDGFMQTSRAFDPDVDGWMEDQLDPHDFVAVKIGQQTEQLIAEVNALRRENWCLQKSNREWMSAAGFGTKEAT